VEVDWPYQRVVYSVDKNIYVLTDKTVTKLWNGNESSRASMNISLVIPILKISEMEHQVALTASERVLAIYQL